MRSKTVVMNLTGILRGDGIKKSHEKTDFKTFEEMSILLEVIPFPMFKWEENSLSDADGKLPLPVGHGAPPSDGSRGTKQSLQCQSH